MSTPPNSLDRIGEALALLIDSPPGDVDLIADGLLIEPSALVEKRREREDQAVAAAAEVLQSLCRLGGVS